MKNTSIRFRTTSEEKSKLENFSQNAGKSMSDILRFALAETMRGRVPGVEIKQAAVNVRRQSNHLLEIIDTNPINIAHLRVASKKLRDAAQKFVACK